MVQSIREQGIIEPLIVRPRDGAAGFELVAGERRYRNGCTAGLAEFPCIVRPLSKLAALRIQAIENLQRRDPQPDGGSGRLRAAHARGEVRRGRHCPRDRQEPFVDLRPAQAAGMSSWHQKSGGGRSAARQHGGTGHPSGQGTSGRGDGRDPASGRRQTRRGTQRRAVLPPGEGVGAGERTQDQGAGCLGEDRQGSPPPPAGGPDLWAHGKRRISLLGRLPEKQPRPRLRQRQRSLL